MSEVNTFLGSVPTDRPHVLNLAPAMTEEAKRNLDALPCFQGVDTKELCERAREILCGKRNIADRYTAMLVIVGTKRLDHPEFLISRNKKGR